MASAHVLRLLAFGLLLLPAVSSAQPSQPPPILDQPRQGTLIVRWSIEGHHTYQDCQRKGAARADIVVRDGSGALAAHHDEACAAFGASVPLHPGRYDVGVALKDSNNTQVVPDRHAEAEVVADKQTVILVDFDGHAPGIELP